MESDEKVAKSGKWRKVGGKVGEKWEKWEKLGKSVESGKK